MTASSSSSGLTRRQLLAGGAGVFGGALIGSRVLGAVSAHAAPAPAPVPAASPNPKRMMHLAATDGWVSMPRDPGGAWDDPPFFPDPLAPDPFNTYVFGFRDVTGLSDPMVAVQRGKAQISAPILAFDEEDDVYLTLTNLGLQQRPDLFDGHTLHWHGFVNAIPLFDGVPELSLAVPIGRDFTYFYRCHDAGTYMYHCHFEDVEHVQMGMTGMVYVRPKQNKGFAKDTPTPWTDRNGHRILVQSTIPAGKYAYNDYDGSTGYDREFSFMVTELWSAAHYRDAHIQVNDWTDFQPSFWLLNGRAYPDTIEPNGNPLSTSAGRLQYQPITSRISCNPGDRVLLRLSNLGYQDHAFTADKVDLQVIAKDAALLKGRDGTPNYITTNTVVVGPGESRDVIFTAPSTPGNYLFYDRTYSYLDNGGGAGYGGMMTQIAVSSTPLPPQTAPNG